jgi:hypothetical protein
MAQTSSHRAKGLSPEEILVDYFEHHLDEGAIAEKNGVSRQAVIHHLSKDERYRPEPRTDVDTDEGGTWRQKPVEGHPLADQIREVADRRNAAQEAADAAHQELLPLLRRARPIDSRSPDGLDRASPEFLTLGQLADLTGISRGHIRTLAPPPKPEPVAPRRRRRRTAAK